MKLSFAGFLKPVEIAPGCIAVLEVHNSALFARVASSICSYTGEDASEPYSWWGDDGAEITPKAASLVIPSPLMLPWDERRLTAGVASRLESYLIEDFARQVDLEKQANGLRGLLGSFALSLQSDYALSAELDIRRLLKAFDFGVDYDVNDSLLDKCIKFLSYVSDSGFSATLVFVNLKPFFGLNELDQLYEHAFFLGLSVMLIENVASDYLELREEKYIIDQDLLEFWPNRQSDVSVPPQ